jgi:hypothetical protein
MHASVHASMHASGHASVHIKWLKWLPSLLYVGTWLASKRACKHAGERACQRTYQMANQNGYRVYFTWARGMQASVHVSVQSVHASMHASVHIKWPPSLLYVGTRHARKRACKHAFERAC